MRRSKRGLIWIARVAMSGLLLALVYERVDLLDVRTLLISPRLELLPVVFLQLLANTAISALRWGLVLNADGIRVPFHKLLKSYLVGTFMNLFLPSNIGGDAYRVVDIGLRSRRTSGAFAAVLAERLSGFVALVILGTLFGLIGFHYLPEWQIILIPLLTMIVLSAILGLLFQQRLLRAIATKTAVARVPRLAGLVEDVLESVTQYRRAPRLFLPVMALSFLFQINVIASIFVLSRALNIGTPFLYFCLFVPLISVIEAAPITVFGLGLRDVSYVAFFVPAGMARRDALALALAYVIVTVIYSLLGCVIFFWRTFTAPAVKSPEAHAGKARV